MTLPALILAQLLGTTLWFSSSAALPSLMRDWGLTPADAGLLVSAVQLGFITGTLVFALTNVADVLPASKVFLTAALFGAMVNVLFAYAAQGIYEALLYRFLTGFALAGVYPVGMKVVVGWSPGGIGNALGWLIGALTAGTAMPFLLAGLGAHLPWQTVIMSASLMAALSGLVVAWIGDGPYLGAARRLELRMILRVFRVGGYRRAAMGYFGHMWELYAFWVAAPRLAAEALGPLGLTGSAAGSLGAFAIIASGAVGCVGGGLLSRRLGSRAVASLSMAVSGGLCVLAPLLLQVHPLLYGASLLVWGVFVVSDSAQFSALAAQACPQRFVGTALTLMNSVGFAITIVSIEITSRLFDSLGVHVAWLLAPGPLLGLAALNLLPGAERSPELEDEGPRAPTENLVADPLGAYSAPERSGGPSLF